MQTTRFLQGRRTAKPQWNTGLVASIIRSSFTFSAGRTAVDLRGRLTRTKVIRGCPVTRLAKTLNPKALMRHYSVTSR